MKHVLCFLLLLPVLVRAQEVAHRIEIKDLDSQVQQTPTIQVDGVKDKPVKPRYWLEIEAELEVETTDPSGYIPEISTKWYAIIKDDRTRKPIMVTGEFSFLEIRAKDKTAFVSAFIAPDTLEKITGKEKITEGDIESIALVVSGSGVMNTERHAPGLQMATSEQDSNWWSSGKYQTQGKSILSKAETPFSLLWTDRYPRVKQR